MAISPDRMQAAAPGLVSLYKRARVSLEKAGVEGERAAVYLVLDRSGSMRRHYREGAVQRLAEQVLGLAANLDDDGVVPVVFFSTGVDGVAEIALEAYEGRVNALHESCGPMGRTNYHLAMQAVLDHYEASGSDQPALVVFQTDGGPSSRSAAERLLCSAARLPVFWQFVGFGDPDGKEFDFLRKLDELPVPGRRVVDNAGFYAAGAEPGTRSDAALYDALMGEFPQWLAAARAAGVIRG
ncbi:VWA domain-containing protein [Streptacidiphilus griseoplanus]|uniref:VWA domain-containing protein n=1 Tax=Peterkaempfera griseoplana TaxID=66896 RepID=UPI0006E32153|nr:VWA domain-containing protein [Peterkaempfera griseoplana]